MLFILYLTVIVHIELEEKTIIDLLGYICS